MLAHVRSARREHDAHEGAAQNCQIRGALESWIIHALDDAPGDSPRPTARPALRLLRVPEPEREEDKRLPVLANGGWARLHVTRRGSVGLARIAIDSLLKPQVLDETAEELLALAGAGSGRLVLDLAPVVRLASAFVATLVEVHRRCAAREGGAFRLCGLRAELGPIMSLTGLDRLLHVFPDAESALAHPWPRPVQAAVLPVAVLKELAALPGRSPAANTQETTEVPVSLLLRVSSGRRKGTSVAIYQEGATIGRAAECRIRCRSMSVSRRHAVIDRTPEGWVLRDLGSTNGTWLNGQRVVDAEQVLIGDMITLGSASFEVVAGDEPTKMSTLDDLVAGWLEDPERDVAATRDDADDDQERKPPLPGDVLVIAPRVEESDDPEAWRSRLEEAISASPCARIVVDLERVAALPSRALGILIALALELRRTGGGLRLAHPQVALRARLDWLRVSEVVDVYNRVEDAVLTAWS